MCVPIKNKMAAQRRVIVGETWETLRRGWPNVEMILYIWYFSCVKIFGIFWFWDFSRSIEFASFHFYLVALSKNNFREILEFANLSSSQKLKPREYYQVYSILLSELYNCSIIMVAGSRIHPGCLHYTYRIYHSVVHGMSLYFVTLGLKGLIWHKWQIRPFNTKVTICARNRLA